jgi:hypothetical protein
MARSRTDPAAGTAVAALAAGLALAACATPSLGPNAGLAPGARGGAEPARAGGGEVAAGWEAIPGPSGTACLDGSEYVFFVRRGDPRRLAIYLDGGGACWNGQNCDLDGRPTAVARLASRERPALDSGVFDFANPDNPLRGFTVVLVPYCTGDVHLGARTVTYTSEDGRHAPRTFEVRHQGAANATAVVDWAFAHFDHPDLVFVTGSSAGAIASPLIASRSARRWPRARVVQLGDAAGGYRTDAVPRLLAGWGAADWLRNLPDYRDVEPGSLTFENLYVLAARAAPEVTFAQFNSAHDATQRIFLHLVGVHDAPLPRFLKENLGLLRGSLARFHTFTAPGSMHSILPRPELYNVTAGGVRFRDWLASLLDGKPVADVGDELL